MIRTIVGRSVVICFGVLLLPWLVDTGAPSVAKEMRGAHHLAVAELAGVPLARLSHAGTSPK